MSYYLAPSLVTLRNQINARWPNRDKASDGWIGDASHAARPSDHNPDYSAGGVVRAIDVDKDGIDVDELLAAVLADPRTRYVIWNHRIWTRDTKRWAPYSGANAHTKHVHISIRDAVASAASDTSPWRFTTTPTPQEDDMPLTPDEIKKIATAAADAVWDRKFQATTFDGQKIPGDTAGQRLLAVRKLAARQDRRAAENLILARGYEAALKELAKAKGIDGTAIAKTVRESVDKALADVEITLTT